MTGATPHAAGARRTTRAVGALIGLAALLVALLTAPAAAQEQRPTRPLAPPNAEFAEPLSGPLRIVELPDGRVLIHDTKEKRLAIADLASGELTDVAREGSGPTEFRSALALLRAPGDSIWLYDLVQSRVLVLGPDARPARTQLFAGAGDPMAMMNRPMVREHDRGGRGYGEVRAMSFSEGRMSFSDSVLLVRTSGTRADTLATMPNYVRAPSFDGQVIRMRIPGFPPMDAWGVFPDGRVMVVRGVRYVPELYLADGTRRSAPALPFPRLAITAADRTKLMDDSRKALEEGLNMGRAMSGNNPMPRFELLEPEQWQTHKPPLAGTVILVDAKLRAWVPVQRRANDPGERFELLDADGKLLETITLPKDVTLLGFGRGVVYTQRKDSDDLLWLQRHSLP
jgi:hypothetical protein